jgi:hypothetical protein
MDKEQENNNIKESTKEDDPIKKLVQPETELEIPVGDGQRKRVFWRRLGFEGRSYFKSYFKKRLYDMVKSGILSTIGTYRGNPEGIVDGKNTIFTLNTKSIDEKTLKVFEGSTLKQPGIDYTYALDLGVLFFIEPPKSEVIVEYEYYDEEIYREIFNDSFIIALIYLSAMDIKDHNKRVFNSVDEIGRLTINEINEIVGLYTKTKPTDKELKNLSGPQS